MDDSTEICATVGWFRVRQVKHTTPQKLGKYEVREEIGRGGTGVVYAAFDPYIGREVALKVALAESLKDPIRGSRQRDMFFNEAHTAGLLRHPNILSVLDAGIDDDLCYIVSELVKGGETLRAYCQPDTLLSVDKVLEIIACCARALDYAHQRGVVHRDIKPSNILMTVDMEVKIADFSIAHAEEVDNSQTMPLHFVGSPRYMSPEQIFEDVVTAQTDLFSLGVVAYQLLTGQHPFSGGSFSAVIHRIVNERPESLCTLRPELPEGLSSLVLHALEKPLNRRFRSGQEMAAEADRLALELGGVASASGSGRFADARRLSFFADFEDEEVREILTAGSWLHAKAGQVVLNESDVDASCYVVVSGEVELRSNGRSACTLKVGDCFGERGFTGDLDVGATATAVAPSSLIRLNAVQMEQVAVDSQLRFYKRFAAALAARLSATTRELAALRY